MDEFDNATAAVLFIATQPTAVIAGYMISPRGGKTRFVVFTQEIEHTRFLVKMNPADYARVELLTFRGKLYPDRVQLVHCGQVQASL